jgi:hypothetical protein
MVDFLKRLAEVVPLLDPYPPWVKVLVSCWTIFSATVVVALLFAPRKSIEVEPMHLAGRVITGNDKGVNAASVEVLIGPNRVDTVTDSEGYFRVDTTPPRATLSGRVRVVAAGYRSFERILEIRTDSEDIGTFALQQEGTGAGDSEALAAELRRRQDALFEVPRDIVDRYVPIVSRGNAGVITLLSDQAIEKNRSFLRVQGDGRYYSFVRRTHEYGYGSDIEFRDGGFSVGFAGLDFGYILNLDDVPFASLAEATAEPPSWLPPSKRAAWTYMWNYKPPNVVADVRRAQRESDSNMINGVAVTRRSAAVPGNSYLLRSMDFDRSDLLVGLRAERFSTDGSVFVAWRILKMFDTPVATGPEPN